MVSQPASRPITVPVLPRTSSSGSGFFFWGIRLEPVATESSISKKPNSSPDSRMTSSASRLRCTIASAQAYRNDATKSRSPDASMLLATTRENPSLAASQCTSTS